MVVYDLKDNDFLWGREVLFSGSDYIGQIAMDPTGVYLALGGTLHTIAILTFQDYQVISTLQFSDLANPTVTRKNDVGKILIIKDTKIYYGPRSVGSSPVGIRLVVYDFATSTIDYTGYVGSSQKSKLFYLRFDNSYQYMYYAGRFSDNYSILYKFLASDFTTYQAIIQLIFTNNQ